MVSLQGVYAIKKLGDDIELQEKDPINTQLKKVTVPCDQLLKFWSVYKRDMPAIIESTWLPHTVPHLAPDLPPQPHASAELGCRFPGPRRGSPLSWRCMKLKCLVR